MVQESRRRAPQWTSTLLASAVIGFFGLASERAAAQQWPSYATLLNGNVLPDTEVAMLSHSDKLFPVRPVSFARDRWMHWPQRTKKLGNVTFQSGGEEYDLLDYIATNRVAELLVLKDCQDRVRRLRARHRSSKPDLGIFLDGEVGTSTLLAVALKRGLIKSLDEPVTRYVLRQKGELMMTYRSAIFCRWLRE